jgi:regulator of sigma E protease
MSILQNQHNFLFAILLLSCLYGFYGQPLTPSSASAIIKGSAADVAGFRPHDRVIAIDGETVQRFEDIRQRVMIALDSPMKFTVMRDLEKVELTATPKRETFSDRFGFEHERGVLGLIGGVDGFGIDKVTGVQGVKVSGEAEALSALKKSMDKDIEVTFKGIEGDDDTILLIHPVSALNDKMGEKPEDDDKGNMVFISEKVGDDIVRHSPFKAVLEAVKETKNVTVGTLTALGQIFTGTRSATELGGLIRIGTMAGDMAQAGIIAVITFTALLSINLGLINLFPIPGLDGGSIVYALIEKIRGKPVSVATELLLHRLTFIIFCMVLVHLLMNLE